MKLKNKYIYRLRISEAKFREISHRELKLRTVSQGNIFASLVL